MIMKSKEAKMDDTKKVTRIDCEKEKISSRVVGFFILGFSLLLTVIGGVLISVFGIFYTLPLWILGLVFVIAPESKVCKILMGKTAST